MKLPALLFVSGLLACTTSAAVDFTIRSADFKPAATIGTAQVYQGYGCTGKNMPPEVSWQGVPAGTRSFALTLFDPDANAGKGWWHWLVIDIPATTQALPTGGKLPQGALTLRNDFGEADYGGPCPPSGDPPHHYALTVYALDVAKLPLTANSKPGVARDMIEKHTLAHSRIIARYGR